MNYPNRLFKYGHYRSIEKIRRSTIAPLVGVMALLSVGCGQNGHSTGLINDTLIHLVTLDPGHFHAALIQKEMYPDIDTNVRVYAPQGPDVQTHLDLIDRYNRRGESPTSWHEIIYTAPDYLQKMVSEKAPGSIVVIAGNNQKKTEYIRASVAAGMNVLSDKPMAVTVSDFNVLKEAFATAIQNKVLLYDIMTSRYEITNILQKELMQIPGIFGTLENGTTADPAIRIIRTHYFLKLVSGMPLIRPVWYFDVDQEGYGLVDVTTHLVDLVQWECFPNDTLNYKSDIEVFSARRWPTKISLDDFKKMTKVNSFPAFLKKDIKDDTLSVSANGEMNYMIKKTHVKITMIWNTSPSEGEGDSHYCSMQGTRANLVIRQGKMQHYKPTLYIEPVQHISQDTLNAGMAIIQKKYPGVTFKNSGTGWEVVIPSQYIKGHEQHFAAVTRQYLTYLKEGRIPDQEIANMIAKYYTTTQALQRSFGK